MKRDLKFFITSNFGGGGQTVSRLFTYLPLLNNLNSKKINILMNFRYLKYFLDNDPFYKYTPVFNGKILEKFDEEEKDFNQFFNNQQNLLEIEEIGLSKSFSNLYPEKDLSILLDSGSGALIRDLISSKGYSKNSVVDYINNLAKHHMEYLERKSPEYAIALDFCDKNTYKDVAKKDPKINSVVSELISDNENQLSLLTRSLELSIENKIKTKLYAPLHGESEEELLSNFEAILNIESKIGNSFYGVALGGLRQWSAKKDGNKIIGNIISKIKTLKPNKSIHILGSSGLNRIIPFVYAGANSFDCHTYWRRANDGSRTSKSESKIVTPLLDSRGQILDYEADYFKNIDLVNLNIDRWKCDCYICSEVGLNFLIKLYKEPHDNEDYYYAKMLIYFHSVYQYQFLFNKLENMTNDNIFEFVYSLKDTPYTNKLKDDIEFITT